MPKVALPLALAIALSLSGVALTSARADVIKLKSGETYEGTILRESETEVVALVKISDGITDEQTFQRDLISEVITTPADHIELQKLARYEIGPHSKTPASYNLAIAAYENFLKRFPESSEKGKVAVQIQALKDERARVARKEVKISNRWYTAEEIKEEQYQIAAQRLLQVMGDQAAKGDLVGALNTFDKLETDYPGSAAYPQAIPSALALISRLRAEIVRAVPIAKQQQQKFDEGIQHTREPERTQMIAAHRRSIAHSEAAFTQSTAKWKPFYAVMDQSVTALTTTISAETPRLSALDTTPMAKSLELTDEGREALVALKYTDASERFSEALAIWKENEAATRLKAQAENLKARNAATEAAEEATAPATPAADSSTEPETEKKAEAENPEPEAKPEDKKG